MGGKKRITRPEPERREPIRRWPPLFGVEPTAGAHGDGNASHATRRSLGDAVSRSVDLGYRVIDEYIRQGQRAAQRLGDRSYGSQAMASDVQELTMRVGQYASEFAALWFELVQVAVSGAVGGQAPLSSDDGSAAAAGGPPAGGRADAAPAHVRIAITSRRPAEVAVDLRPDAVAKPLLVHALRAVDPALPRVNDVAFEPAANGEPPTLRLRVPPKQPAGVYQAVIVDPETSRPAGTVTLRITAD